MKTSSRTSPSIVTEAATFIGIDYHKKYSVWHAIDAAGTGVSVQLLDKAGGTGGPGSVCHCLTDARLSLKTGLHKPGGLPGY